MIDMAMISRCGLVFSLSSIKLEMSSALYGLLYDFFCRHCGYLVNLWSLRESDIFNARGSVALPVVY